VSDMCDRAGRRRIMLTCRPRVRTHTRRRHTAVSTASRAGMAGGETLGYGHRSYQQGLYYNPTIDWSCKCTIHSA
jgi:hypothetical protein